ncbi:3'(2'),5'-bisphosphate nucleotidase CysQ [Candidatus Peregrinibacteria bacterium]|nr:3'(2'),5'-bisphosphate nucleotidase CysQ [Candidatus Peregrinibacteria bacterium]
MLTQVIPLIKKAGKEILSLYNKDYEVFKKEDKSPVTEADILSDKIIIEGLKSFGFPILSEESQDDLSRMRSEKVWIVDSLDGTQDFLDKTDEFCIMIGLSEKGHAILGLVYLPVQDKLYFAEKGKGSFVQVGDSEPKKIHVSDESDITKSKLIVSRNHLSRAIEDVARHLNIGEMVKCGSNGVKMGLVAEGKADLFFNPTNRFGQWDCCAPQIIVEEAGGIVTGIHGEVIIYNQENIKNPFGLVATNGILHSTVINEFSE